tara:strand:- start:2242 stop:3966 length:1725 start_codon:yes stop_codon:yes gene_type:complete
MAYSSIKLYEQMRKALSAPKRKKSSATIKLKNPKMVPGAENWQAGAIIAKSAAEALKNYSAEQEDKADKAAAMRMLIDYNKPQAEFDPSKYGQTPDQLRDTGYKTVNYATTGEGDFGGDNVYDGDEPLSRDPEEAKAWQALYKEEADKTQNRFDEENPYGMARVKAGNYASLDGRAFPILSNIFGDKPDPKNMTEGDRASAMRMALMGDSIGRRDAETERLRVIDAAAKKRNQTLGDAERGYVRKQLTAKNLAAAQANAAEKLAENRLAIAQAKPVSKPTSYREWELSKSPIPYEKWLKSRPPSGRPAAGLQYEKRYNEIKNDTGPNGGEEKANKWLRRFVNTAIVNQGNKFSFRADVAGEGAGPTARINLKPGEELPYKAKSAQASAVGAAVGKDNLVQYNVAKASYENQRKNNDLINHLETSDARTGLGAEFLNNIDRAKALFGDLVAAGRVADTEELDVRMGSEVFPLIKSLGIGARGMDTPAEREFMRQVLTGRIGLNKETLLRMARMRSKEAGYQISNWNKRVNSGELDNFFKYSGVPKSTLKPFPTAQEKAATGKKLRDRYGLTERPQ